MRTWALSKAFRAPAGAVDRFGGECLHPRSQQTMPLSPGTRLRPFAVTGKVGERGMGQVWQAGDIGCGRGTVDPQLEDRR